jgi:23S rRNA pseudouridine2605 synthase
MTRAKIDKLKKGIRIDGMAYGAIEVTVDKEQGSNVWLTMALKEGKNREIRKVLEFLGLKVNRLIRISYGPFHLGEMAEGEVEEVSEKALKEALGKKFSV